jgi:hypothetical protein
MLGYLDVANVRVIEKSAVKWRAMTKPRSVEILQALTE